MNRKEPHPAQPARDPRVELASAITPFVEDALRSSVRKNPRPLVEVLVPVLGPAIRQAIGDAMRAMMQALDNVLGVSLSRQGLKWRIEAWRCGKPFAEVALLHSLLYRVEAALFVHRKTGHLLQQAAIQGRGVTQPELVSAMSVALQDFVEDSFRERLPAGENQLRTLQVGELTIWIEHAPLASLVAIIRGHPPESLRVRLDDALTAFERMHRDTLEKFSGDVAPFDDASYLLRDLLVEVPRPRRKRSLARAYAVLAAALAVVLGIVGFFVYRAAIWRKFVHDLEHTPGVVVTDAGRSNGKYVVSGLRDPYAEDPRRILAHTRIDPEKVAFHMRPFVSLEPPLLASRIRDLLDAPPGVTLRVESDQVVLGGHAPLAWIQETRARARTLRDLGLAWREEQLVTDETIRLSELHQSIGQRAIFFAPGRSELDDRADAELRAVAAELREIERLARVNGDSASVTVVGHSSSEGGDARNRHLSRERAVNVRKRLIAMEVPASLLRAEGRGVTPTGRRVEFVLRT